MRSCTFDGEVEVLEGLLVRYIRRCVSPEEREAPDTKYRQETPEDLKLLPSKLLQNISSPPTLARGAGIPNGQEMVNY
uniref:Uncharacterized protein n=1 Tax=Oryza nivara TaxID=4536 RepID=A0A0E0GXU9_ORYNI